VKHVGDRLDLRLEQSERVRVGDHEHGGVVAEFGLQVVEIDKPLRIALDRDGLEPGEGG
jgi:hypothetical protein